MQFDLKPLPHVVFGSGRISEVDKLASDFDGKSCLIVTDAGIVAAGHVDIVLASMEKSGFQCKIFADVEENPTGKHVDRGLLAAKNARPNMIIGLGGGSAMDCAKAINFLYTNGGKIEDYQGYGKAKLPMLPSIGIPTTAGTGSEAQSYALISQESSHKKMACGDTKARFRTVILDPEVIVSTPAQVRAVTGIDAIAHALESYVCKKSNPVTKMYAAQAWKRLSTNFEASLRDNASTQILGDMLLGAHFAGIAIETAMLGAAHASANPLTAQFGLTHGIAVGLMLPYVLRYNSNAVNGGYDQLLNATRNGKDSASLPGAESLAAQVQTWMEKANLWRGLRNWGISKTDLPTLAQQASEEWTGKFNPRPVTKQAFSKLYEQAF